MLVARGGMVAPQEVQLQDLAAVAVVEQAVHTAQEKRADKAARRQVNQAAAAAAARMAAQSVMRAVRLV